MPITSAPATLMPSNCETGTRAMFTLLATVTVDVPITVDVTAFAKEVRSSDDAETVWVVVLPRRVVTLIVTVLEVSKTTNGAGSDTGCPEPGLGCACP